MTDNESSDDTNDYVVVTPPGPETTTGQPPHIIQKIKSWLSPTDTTSPASEYRKHLHSHVAGTGEWILNTDQYRRWSETGEIGDLWIRGIPGSGKSVVAASMVKRLQRRGDAPVLFFFFREIIQANRTPHSLVRDFCFGLLEYSVLIQSKLKVLMEGNYSVESVSFDDLWKCLSGALAAIPKVYCVVDALDEMEPGHDGFLQDLLNLGRQSPQSIKLMLTSRQLPHLEKHLKGSCLLDLRLDRRHVDSDIAIYISQRLETCEATLTPDEASKIKEAICERGKGLFLYVRLMTDQLLLDPTNIISQLDKLPDGLGSMYTRVLREHAAKSQTTPEFQKLILEWITHSARPLRLLELSTMVDSLPDRGGLAPDQNAKLAIRSTCGPLLEVCEDGVIQIIHHSLTEFLLDRDVSHVQAEGQDREYAVLNAEDTHERILRTCITYLNNCLDILIKDEENKAKWMLKFHFLKYAANNWEFHAAIAEADGTVLSFLDELLQDGARFKAWRWLWDGPNTQAPIPLMPLHIVADAGLAVYAEYMINNGADKNALDTFGRTPLMYAVDRGENDVVNVFLKHNADLHMLDRADIAAIHHAVIANEPETLRILLKAGTDPLTAVGKYDQEKMMLHSHRMWGETPLSYSCDHGYVDIIHVLLEFIDPSHLQGLLHRAAKGDAKGNTLAILLSHEGVRRGIDDHDANGNTPLYLAAKDQNAATVRALLSHGADVNVRSLERKAFRTSGSPRKRMEEPVGSFTPIHGWANLAPSNFCMGSGHLSGHISREVLQLLVDAGCDINARDQDGQTVVFSRMLFDWNERALRGVAFLTLLLEFGADVSVMDSNGQTPLHRIDFCPDQGDVVKMLVKAGVDINAVRKSDGRSPLLIAAYDCHLSNPVVFQELGADFYIQDHQGNTVLHYICKSYRRTGTRSALEYLPFGDVHARNNEGRTPLAEFLWHSFGDEDMELVKHLIEQGADLECQDNLGQTALLTFLAKPDGRSHNRIAKELLKLGADANAADYQGRSALHYAARRPCFGGDASDKAAAALWRDLLNFGANIHAVDHQGNSVLHNAIHGLWREGRYFVNALVELGASLHIRNHQGRTALHHAAETDSGVAYETGKEKMTRLDFLLQPKFNFDINARDHLGVTPLHLAAATSDISTWNLIKHGAEIEAKTAQGRTALHFAAEAGECNALGALIEAYQKQSLPIDGQSNKGRTALHEAARSGRPESVKLLLDAGASISIPDKRGRMALHAAAEFENVNRARRKQNKYDSSFSHVERNKSWKSNDPFDKMGLLVASEKDTKFPREVVRLLIAAGADPGQLDSGEHTASDIAFMLGSYSLVEDLASDMSKMYASADSRLSPLDPIGETLSSWSGQSMAQLVQAIDITEGSQAILRRAISTDNVRLVEELMRSRRVKSVQQDEIPALHLAARWGLTSMMKALLPYVEDPQNVVPGLINTAAKRSLCNIEMVKLLIDTKVNLESLDKKYPGSDSPAATCTLAAGQRWWHSKALALLLEAGASTEVTHRGLTPVVTALKAGSAKERDNNMWCDETLDVLLKHRANVNSSENGTTPLAEALEGGRDSTIIQKLVDYGADLSSGDFPALASAIRSNSLPLVEMMLKAGADPNIVYSSKPRRNESSQPYTPLLESAEKDASIVEMLLAHGADPHLPLKDGATSVLHELCTDKAPLTPIIASGCDLERRDAQGRTPLHRACAPCERPPDLSRRKDEKAVAERAAGELLARGVDIHAVDNSGSTALHYAVASRLRQTVEILLEKGASAIARDNTGRTPLHYAIHSDVSSYASDVEPSDWHIRALLAAGADLLDPLPDGLSALHIIAPRLMEASGKERAFWLSEGVTLLTYKALYQLFLDAGCNREARDKDGNTPIFAYFKHVREYCEVSPTYPPDPDDLRQMATDHDIHTVNNNGDTLLHVIAEREEDEYEAPDDGLELFKILVEMGLDPMRENKDGATALDVAAAYDKDEILALFARDE